MFRSVDLKSLLIGGLLVVAVVCAMGGAPMMNPEFHGRFTLVAHNKDGGSVYVLDTATGQVWQRQTNVIPNSFFDPKLEGYAPVEQPVDPNW
ncbi:MAG: hypothetical protein JW955_22505 [Sedimentisphaerales bacterium]|nr:hypothetical protein [Sedimentisphaerales bacterium]